MNGNFPQTQEQFIDLETTVLQPGSGEMVSFRPDSYVPDAVYEGIDLNANPLVAEIDAGGNRMIVLKDVNRSDYFLMSAAPNGYRRNEDGKMIYVPGKAYPIPPHGTGEFIMGRNAIREADDKIMAASPVVNYLSRNHFSISHGADDEIKIQQIGDTYETKVVYAEAEEDPDRTIPKEELAQILSRTAAAETVRKPLDVGMAEKALRGEDRVLIDRDRGLYGVFDGAGGHEGAAQAAEVARFTFAETFANLSVGMTPEQVHAQMRSLMFKAMEAADAALTQDEKITGISTGTAVGISEDKYGYKTAVCVSVGDSRCYVFHPDSGHIRQVTQDEGEGRYLDNALGGEGANIQQLHSVTLAEGDTLMICSDGITGDTEREALSDEDIAAVLKHAGDSQTAAETLMAISKKRDDKSVVVVRV